MFDPKEILNSLTAAIKEARIRQGLTQKEVAEKVGIHHQTYSSFERGEADKLAIIKILEICKIVGVNFSTGEATEQVTDMVAVTDPLKWFSLITRQGGDIEEIKSDIQKIKELLEKLAGG